MSPEHIEAWIGVVTGVAGLSAGGFKVTRRVFRGLDRLELALSTVEARSVQLDHNGGSSMRDDAFAGRVAAEAALVEVRGLVSRFDSHLEQHAAMPSPARRRS